VENRFCDLPCGPQKIFEGRCHIHKSAFNGTFGHFIDPRKLILFDGIKLRPQSQCRWFATRL